MKIFSKKSLIHFNIITTYNTRIIISLVFLVLYNYHFVFYLQILNICIWYFWEYLHLPVHELYV